MLKIGDFCEASRTYDEKDVAGYVNLGGAKPSQNIVPEILINALFSNLLGVELPGRGTNYLKQETKYFKPIFVGETILARVEITRIREDKKIVDLLTECKNSQGEIIATGRALVSVRDVDGAI